MLGLIPILDGIIWLKEYVSKPIYKQEKLVIFD